MVFFIVFSVIQYQKAQKHHSNELDALLLKNQKEMLAAQLVVKEKTLDNISTELHDNVGQILSLAKLNLHQQELEAGSNHVSESISLIDEAITGIRSISHIISSNKLDDTELSELLLGLVDQINNSGAIVSNFQLNADLPSDFDAERSFIIYRMVQESINNIIKHADAKKIDIIVEELEGKFLVRVIDDGKGFDVRSKVAKSNGLQNLYKRAEAIAAELTINSEKGIGTEVKIIFTNKINQQNNGEDDNYRSS